MKTNEQQQQKISENSEFRLLPDSLPLLLLVLFFFFLTEPGYTLEEAGH